MAHSLHAAEFRIVPLPHTCIHHSSHQLSGYHMNTTHRILIAISAVLLCGLYAFPLWQINLEAPQYPEGLGLRIHINTIVGEKEQDLASINNLNHYIGMKRIEPDSIAELRYMPTIVASLIVLALAVVAFGKRWMLLSWVVVFIALGVAGMIDFYNWEYDYGHNLNPHAAICIPDMTYQPPLIGGKQLLNFHALSLPGVGGYLMFVSLALGAFTWWKSKPIQKKNAQVSLNSSGGSAARINEGLVGVALLGMCFALNACSDKAEAIHFGSEECAHCKMTITDQRFGAELITKKTKVYKFDSIECMLGFEQDKSVDPDDIATEWVVDYANPGNLIAARKAWYLKSEKLPSPMGLNLSAYGTKEAYEASHATNGGELYYFDSARLLVAKTW